jgi:hypothetical protein
MVAQLHITKLAAAEWQLRAAIRMFFADEDELAIHTVASAAYRVIADLKTAQGVDETEDVFLASIFYAVRDYRRGTLPEDMKSNPELMAWVRGLADQLPINENTSIRDVSITLTRKNVSDFWNQRNKVANFLKHADRDPRESLTLEDVDNLLLLAQSYSAYLDLTHNDLGNEGLVFRLFLDSKRYDHTITRAPHVERIIQKLIEVSEGERLNICSVFISELNKGNAHPT